MNLKPGGIFCTIINRWSLYSFILYHPHIKIGFGSNILIESNKMNLTKVKHICSVSCTDNVLLLMFVEYLEIRILSRFCISAEWRI